MNSDIDPYGEENWGEETCFYTPLEIRKLIWISNIVYVKSKIVKNRYGETETNLANLGIDGIRFESLKVIDYDEINGILKLETI